MFPLPRGYLRYLWALRRGEFRLGRGLRPSEQAMRYLAAIERNRGVNDRVRPVLARCGVPALLRPDYHNFAYALDRVKRKYAGRTRENQTALLIHLFTLKGLEPAVLQAVTAALDQSGPGGLRSRA